MDTVPTSGEVPQPTQESEPRNPLFDAARKVLLAGIGAFALAQDEVEDFVNKLVERGEIAEKEGKNLIQELRDKRKKSLERAETEITRRIEEVLVRMNIPTKADIQALSDRIASLSKKVDELKKSQK